jgi:hypothetical protein
MTLVSCSLAHFSQNTREMGTRCFTVIKSLTRWLAFQKLHFRGECGRERPRSCWPMHERDARAYIRYLPIVSTTLKRARPLIMGNRTVEMQKLRPTPLC